jgi:hypothetical protein
LAENSKSSPIAREKGLDVEHLRKRLDMLDQRLDNIDSMVTAVAERVMKQPVTFMVSCPNCGSTVEVALFGIQKPSR